MNKVRNDNNSLAREAFFGLFGVLIIGIGLTVWLGAFGEDELNPAYRNLLEVSDWMMKSSVGAILGFAGSTHLSRRNGGSE